MNVGLVYTYLAGHVGHFGEEGAFRALERGYAHWASGRLQELQVNTNQFFCHVKCTTSLICVGCQQAVLMYQHSFMR